MIRKIIHPVREMAERGQLTGVLLMASTLISMLLSNSFLQENYLHLWHLKIGIPSFSLSLHHWINDGLMVVLFFMVGLEIRRELVHGELAEIRKSMLPILAAVGGMALPAVFYAGINFQNGKMQGWAIPTATDIAFSLGVLSLMGNKVPFSLKIFLTALAIIDDLGAVLVIAVFYTDDINIQQLMFGGATFLILLAFNRFKIRSLLFYILPGLILWWFIYHSGIHATIAGVLLAFCIPIAKVEALEHALQKPVNYLVLPLFALANTAIIIPAGGAGVLLQPVGIGIIAGLFLGKPLGIILLSWLAVKAGWAQLPALVSWRKLLAAGCMAGIGFTMSLFIANLSFEIPEVLDSAKLAILAGSMASGLAGAWLLLTDKHRVIEDENQ